MPIHSRRWLAGALMLAAAVALQAQEGRGSGRLTGSVVDENGAPLENVKITLKYVEFSNERETQSNAKGLWTILGLGKGVAQITGELEGYTGGIVQRQISGVSPNAPVHLVLKKGLVAVGDAAKDAILSAHELFDQRQYEEALALYQDFAQKNPDNFSVGIYIARCQIELGEYGEAETELQKVLAEVTKKNADLKGNITAAQVYAGIGDIYLRQEKFKLAEENFRRSIDIQPGDPALPYNVAEIMFLQNKPDEAERYYQMAIQIKPEWPKPYLKLAYVSLNKGQMDKAVEYLKQFCALGKDDPKFAEGQALLDTLQKK